MKRFFILLGTLAFFVTPEITSAQWSVFPHVVVSLPQSDFANVSGTGGGFGVRVAHRMNFLGGIQFGGDFAFLSHGKEFETVQTFSGPFVAEVRKESFRLTFGPQYTFGASSVRFHVGAQGGFYFFRTNVNLPTSFGFFQDERDSDAALGWNVGGGLQYDFGLGPWLDIAVEYQTISNLTTTIQDPNDEANTIKNNITAREITLKFGLIFFLGS